MKEKKEKLRRIINAKLKKMNDDGIRKASEKIAASLTELPQWKKAEIVFGFMPMSREIDVTSILRQAFSEGKQVAVPRMKDGRFMDFHFIESLKGPWEDHPYGIREPKRNLPVVHPDACPDLPLLILVPGLAFDRQGNRLGRGKGFYDTYLAAECSNVSPIGLAFSIQIVDSVPVSDHDRRLPMIITEKEVIVP